VSLSHVDSEGRARMVDVGGKTVTDRTATASGCVRMSSEAFEQVRTAAIKKGDVLAVAEVAGVMAAKRTAELIPLCHPIGLDAIRVEAALDPGLPGVQIRATASLQARTGVEMEALTAVAVACLTVYDMVKGIEPGVVIERIELLDTHLPGDFKRLAGDLFNGNHSTNTAVIAAARRVRVSGTRHQCAPR